jgi:hypothetical protein
LTQAIEIRAERVGREVLFPEARGEEMDVEGGRGVDALQHVHAVDIGIDALQAARREQTLHDAHIPLLTNPRALRS